VIGKNKARVLDLCCGVGTSTRALQKAFPDAEYVIGLDTSAEMVAMAGFLNNHLSFFQPFADVYKKFSSAVTVLKEQGKAKRAGCRPATFQRGNAEQTHLPDKSFDLVTVMYAFHEAPCSGREKILREARRVLQPGGVLAVVDICTDYAPTESMLKGEPYVLEYQQNIHKQLESIKGFLSPEYKTLIPGHVGIWTLKRSPNAV
jgi:ubiquinone/menaquinone biosynthesis C-methylase UbiE